MANQPLPYDALLAEAPPSTPMAEYLRQELPYLWLDAYFEMTPRPTNVVAFTHGTFEYPYDDYATSEATGPVGSDAVTEARLVAAVGFSRPVPRLRDDSRPGRADRGDIRWRLGQGPLYCPFLLAALSMVSNGTCR
jgi:hypothetical protein